MTTIGDAIKSVENDEQAGWSITAHVLCRQIFTIKRDGQIRKLLILVMIDFQGQVIEVKSWSEKKAYTVYRKFKENSCLEISGSGPFREPNRKYSRAKCEIYSRWFLEPSDTTTGPFAHRHKIYLQAFSNIHKFHLKTVQNSSGQPATVVGLFYELSRGPVRKSSSGHIVAQGYYVKLLDERGRVFQVLVWSNISIEKDKFALNYCDQGSENIVLILYAREQEQRYQSRTQGIYTLTSTYPPVVNPQCLNDTQRLNLLKHSLTIENGCSVNYVPGDINCDD